VLVAVLVDDDESATEGAITGLTAAVLVAVLSPGK